MEFLKKPLDFRQKSVDDEKHRDISFFRNFSQKQSKGPVNSSMAVDFRFSYLLIKYRKVSGSDDTRNHDAP